MVDESREPEEQDESYWTSRRSRRQLLKLAGVGAAVGTTAMVVSSADPASAANGDNAIIGTTNVGANGTSFESTGGGAGLVGFGNASNSVGVVAEGTTAVDLKCAGTGRLGMISGGTSGLAAPSWTPSNGFTTGTVVHEFARGNNGEIWASRGLPDDTHNRWKRVNAVRTDSADGTGAYFVPSRVVDTRSSHSPLGAGATRNIQIAGTGSGASTIPPDAVAVFGNLTALPASGSGFANSGYLSLYPQGVARPAPSNLNPVKGGSVASNFFFCGLSSAGQLTIFSYLPVHFLIDVFAYVQ